jgi:hypothetical protein
MIEKGGGAGGTGNTCDVCESGGENTARSQPRPSLGERRQLHLVSEVLLDVFEGIETCGEDHLSHVPQ